MLDFFNDIYNLIMNIISGSSVYGPLFACLLILVESILPVLPLFVFITITFIAYGYVVGFIISYVLTVIGCSIAFYLTRHFLKNIFEKKVRKSNIFNNLMKKVDKMDISSLVLLMVIPFTPAFLVNVACSLSKMEYKKFLISTIISKPFLVFFWGFIGTSLIESLKNPKILLIIVVMLAIAYLLSKIVVKKLSLDEK